MEKPTILFLQETKCSGEDLMAYGKRFWKGAETMALDAMGVAGGMGILWDPKLVSLCNFLASRNLLTVDLHI